MTSLLSIYLLLAFSCCFLGSSSEIRKELRRKEVNHDTIIQMGHPVPSNRIDPSRVVQLSWRPRVFLYKGFLSDEECDHLISLAHDTNEKSLRDNDESGDDITNGRLKSLEIPLHIEDDIVSRIEERISAWTFLPKENGRVLRVSRRGLQGDGKNFDYFGNKSTLEASEPLVATVILYLSNVNRGGQILFPKSESQQLKSKILSDCTKGNNILRPIKGNAFLFFTLHPNTTPDTSSSHARCPVLEGEMWYATKFFHVKAIGVGKLSSESRDSECDDEDDNCPSWAATGECEKNPVFMVGSPDYYGTCRKSCKAC
ncbi:probable prolyl 4-hydroxylase 12 isoform X2 [Ziziphus jujuba]|uniref:procollagen-proline 4-dioxygenase n=1 Tax=Ziziphus jujuba TaxID=326968 RepID=A0A6P3ZFM9_ZIZJJ|nr:probable prolyl 4-hydroxylase 12 isoform X2 [Ziziphus jujuba]